ncbi:MAG: prepilin-type N-terminal cleavage/methylation domain-containing protein [Candidatus Paceibacterota bacterium]|jgi:prepilin-type N-terminal cleavage/methylation domain-containing protein
MIKKNLKKINSAGFTLVELLVTLSIFAVTTGIVMTSQGKFDNSILLTNTAYDIALTLRQAQTFGVNVKEGSGNASSKFNPYGVVFNNSVKTRFDLFEDLPGGSGGSNYRYKYDGNFICVTNVDLECVSGFKIKRGHYVKSISIYDNAGASSSVDVLNISFIRPNPEAIIVADVGANIGSYNPALPSAFFNLPKSAEIVISSADNSATRTIIVTKVGQIYVKR